MSEHEEGYTSIEILHFLKGLPLDDMTGAYISAFKPGALRVQKWNSFETLDSRPGRVTIHLDALERIEDIIMEVVVQLPDDCHCGHDLDMRLARTQEQYVKK